MRATEISHESRGDVSVLFERSRRSDIVKKLEALVKREIHMSSEYAKPSSSLAICASSAWLNRSSSTRRFSFSCALSSRQSLPSNPAAIAHNQVETRSRILVVHDLKSHHGSKVSQLALRCYPDRTQPGGARGPQVAKPFKVIIRLAERVASFERLIIHGRFAAAIDTSRLAQTLRRFAAPCAGPSILTLAKKRIRRISIVRTIG